MRRSTVLRITQWQTKLIAQWMGKFGQGIMVRQGGQDVAVDTVEDLLATVTPKTYVRRELIEAVEHDLALGLVRCSKRWDGGDVFGFSWGATVQWKDMNSRELDMTTEFMHMLVRDGLSLEEAMGVTP